MPRTTRNLRRAMRRTPGTLEHRITNLDIPARLTIDQAGEPAIAITMTSDCEVRRGDELLVSIADANTIAAQAGVTSAEQLEERDATITKLRFLLDEERELCRLEMQRTHDLAAEIMRERQLHEVTKGNADHARRELRLSQAANRRKRDALRDMAAAYQHRVDQAEKLHRQAEVAYTERNEAVQHALDGNVLGIASNLLERANEIEAGEGPASTPATVLRAEARRLTRNARKRMGDRQAENMRQACEQLTQAGVSIADVARALAPAARKAKDTIDTSLRDFGAKTLERHQADILARAKAEVPLDTDAPRQRLEDAAAAIMVDAATAHADHDADTLA